MKEFDATDLDESVTRTDIPARIACVGLGFVGYNSAVAFSSSEFSTIGVDTDEGLIDAIRNGNSPFEIQELSEYIDEGVCEVTTTISDADDADAYVISVPTPLSEDDAPDTSYVRAAARDVSTVLEENNLVVVQSTVYPGCTRNVVIPELERSGLEAGSDFGVSHVPERYSPGNDLSDRATRIVGSIDELWRDITAALYETVADETALVSSLEVAETTKLVENIQRDVNIALTNELAAAAEVLGIDISEVLDAAATKWNFQRYDPGLGVGGHCLPIDPHYLRSAVEEQGAELALVPAAREINDSMPRLYRDRILRTIEAVGKRPSATTVSLLGVTYKPNVRDVRNSSAIELMRLLREENVSVEVYDSEYPPDEEIERTGIVNGSTPIETVRNTDVLVMATPHDEFRDFNPAALAAAMSTDPILIDPQRVFDPSAVTDSELMRPSDLESLRAQKLQLTDSSRRISADGSNADRRENDD